MSNIKFIRLKGSIKPYYKPLVMVVVKKGCRLFIKNYYTNSYSNKYIYFEMLYHINYTLLEIILKDIYNDIDYRLPYLDDNKIYKFISSNGNIPMFHATIRNRDLKYNIDGIDLSLQEGTIFNYYKKEGI